MAEAGPPTEPWPPTERGPGDRAPDEPAAVQARIDRTALRLVQQLRAAGATVATAESLTGGLVGAAITGVPGSSRVYRGGVVAYATDLKHQLLGVDAELLARVGAVDGEVAALMAEGARRRLGADYGLATTGVAGPDRQDGKEPGTLYVGLATPRRPSALHVTARGDRAAVRRTCVVVALTQLLAAVQAEGEDPPVGVG